ncbi:exosortase [Alteromonas sp. HB246098]
MDLKVHKFFLVLLSITVLWCLANYPIMVSLWEYSFDDGTYSHAYLVPFIIVYLFYILEQEKRVIFRERLSLPWLGLLAISGMGLVLTTWSQISLLYWAASLATLISLAFCIFRFNVSTLFPFAFLVFIFPFWGALAIPLQSLSVYVVTALMGLTNIPVYVENEFVTIPAGIFEIAEGCSGLRYVIVSAAISSLYVFLYLKTLRSALIFTSVALAGALVTNWLRIVALIVIGHETEMQSSLMTDHNNFGWYIYIPVAIFQFYIGRKLEDREHVAGKSGITSKRELNSPLSRSALFTACGLSLVLSSSVALMVAKGVPNEDCSAATLTIEPRIYNYARVCSATIEDIELVNFEFDGEHLDDKASYYLNSPMPEGFHTVRNLDTDKWNAREISDQKTKRFLIAYRYGTSSGFYKSLFSLKKSRLKNALSGDMSSSIQWIIVPCDSSCNLSNIERALQ